MIRKFNESNSIEDLFVNSPALKFEENIIDILNDLEGIEYSKRFLFTFNQSMFGIGGKFYVSYEDGKSLSDAIDICEKELNLSKKRGIEVGNFKKNLSNLSHFNEFEIIFSD